MLPTTRSLNDYRTEAYPRDMIGYGRTTPDPQWPGDAKIAVQFVLNYEAVSYTHLTLPTNREV